MHLSTWSLFAVFLPLVSAFPQPLNQRASSGCGKRHFFNGLTQYRGLKSGGTDRSYSFHLPSNYDANKAYPLVLGFHGSSGTGLFLELDTKLSESRYSGNVSIVNQG